MMMVINRKILSAFCAGTMFFSFVACGAKETTGNTEEHTSNADSTITNEKESTSVAEISQSTFTTSDSEKADKTEDGGSEKNVLVAYFSWTGNTAPLAEYVAEILDADIYEIKAADEYTDEDIDYGNDSSCTSIEQNDTFVRPEINGIVEDMNQYEKVVLAYPI